MKGRATFVLDKSLMHFWDTRPDIIAQVSTSGASTADPKDTSAFVSRPSPLDVLAAPAGQASKLKGSKRKKARARKPVVDTESEESEETGSSDGSDDEEFGEPCSDRKGRVYKKCTDCRFFKTHKVCRNFHADAPIGTTGARSKLNKKSLDKLKRLNAFGRGGSRRRR